jgi:hypothetical protein
MKHKQKGGGMFTFSSLFATQSEDDKLLNEIIDLTNKDRSIFDEQKRFKIAFAEFNKSNVIPNWNVMNWKELIQELIRLGNENCLEQFDCRDFANEIQNFRNTFMYFITKKACNQVFQSCKTSCLSSGSEDLTSDIDVTVKGHCIKSNLLVLISIRRFISEKYLNFHPFNGNLSMISKFFDVNFYLSDFALLKTQDASDDILDSYYLTDDNKSQLIKINENEVNKKKVLTHFDEYMVVVEEANKTLAELKENHSQTNENKLIDLISQLALYEDECYVTQGAFIHVVYMTQKKKPFHQTLNDRTMKIFLDFMICSILENLHFAVSHPGKSRGKYLMRVFDADYNRRLLMNENDEISKSLRYINDGNIENTIKDLHEYRYKTNLDKQELVNKEDSIKNILTNVETQLIEQVYNKVKDIAFAKASESNLNGGRINFKKLLDKSNNTVKKQVNGKECVIYVDNKRCQYVRQNKQYVSLKEARKSTNSRSRTNKK